MAKFFIKSNQIQDNTIIITGEDVNHIKNVLRKKQGDQIIACDGIDTDYYCKILSLEKEKIILEVLEKNILSAEPNVKIDIFQGLPKFDKMELIIQKTTELGVNKIIPLETKRVVVKLDEKTKIKKIERWQKIAQEAAKQCKRTHIPLIDNVVTIKNVIEKFEGYDIVLLAYEKENNSSIKSIIRDLVEPSKIAVVIGPEGGFEEKEVNYLCGSLNKVKSISLGQRILRTETAGIVILSALMYEFGELE